MKEQQQQQQQQQAETVQDQQRAEKECNKQVQFSTVTIRSYPIVIGDNPSSLAGPPLSIAWHHESEYTIGVHDYEEQRPERRKGREMIIPLSMRMHKLKAAGFAQSEILQYTRPVNIARNQRKRTEATLQLIALHEFFEAASRKIRDLLDLGRRKRRERKFLKQYRFQTERVEV